MKVFEGLARTAQMGGLTSGATYMQMAGTYSTCGGTTTADMLEPSWRLKDLSDGVKFGGGKFKGKGNVMGPAATLEVATGVRVRLSTAVLDEGKETKEPARRRGALILLMFQMNLLADLERWGDGVPAHAVARVR